MASRAVLGGKQLRHVGQQVTVGAQEASHGKTCFRLGALPIIVPPFGRTRESTCKKPCRCLDRHPLFARLLTVVKVNSKRASTISCRLAHARYVQKTTCAGRMSVLKRTEEARYPR